MPGIAVPQRRHGKHGPAKPPLFGQIGQIAHEAADPPAADEPHGGLLGQEEVVGSGLVGAQVAQFVVPGQLLEGGVGFDEHRHFVGDVAVEEGPGQTLGIDGDELVILRESDILAKRTRSK